MTDSVRSLIEEFVGNVQKTVLADALERISSGRSIATVMLAPKKRAYVRRKKAPIQLCPVPGCTNRAAPVFGMVCSKHKDLPKAKIRAHRERRRKAKAAK